VKRSFGLAAGLIAGVAADALAGDPRRGHPVAAFGRAATTVEQRLWRDSRATGAVFAAACVGGAAGLGIIAERATRGRAAYPVVVAVATWAVLGGETLRREAAALHRLLERSELPAARERLTHLVGRDPTGLDESEIARAAVESVAENTSDAVVAPLVWGAVAGVPGLLAYRAVNTLDAMVGNKSDRYLRFGWAAARADDAANLVPARCTALLVGLVGGQRREVWRVVRRDARRHPSPNAGWCEAAYAGSLGLRLGGVNVYGDRVEERPSLGDGAPAQPDDLRRAARLSRRVTWAAAVTAAAVAIVSNR
jgi:adenosylcobinamide-phosphate synthase